MIDGKNLNVPVTQTEFIRVILYLILPDAWAWARVWVNAVTHMCAPAGTVDCSPSSA